MLALVVIALLPALPAQEPSSVPSSVPSSASAPDPVEPAAPDVDACLALLRAGQREQAQACYAARAARNDGQAQLARELADLVGALELTPPGDLEPGKPELALGDLVLSGKAELIATSTLVGAYGATLAATSLVALATGSGASSSLNGLLLLAPVLGGGAGLGLSIAGVLLVDDLSSGDANAVRALMVLGTFNSIMLPLDWAALGGSTGDAASVLFLSMGMLALQGAGIASGLGVAAVTDLHEGAGSFAISAGLWSSVLSILAADAFGAFKTSPQAGVFLVTAAANAGFIGGLVGAQWLPMSRAETWAVDVGGGVGLLAGASIAVFTRAPNPLIGYGTMAAGTVLGLGAGFAAARYLPPMLGGLPEIVALAPITIDDVDPARVINGAVVVGRF